MTRTGAVLVVIALAASAAVAGAQELEPRAYANTPVDMNFLILGYGYSRGDVTLDTAAPIEGAKLSTHTAVLAYARSFGAWGRSAKLDIVLPYAWATGSAEIAGQRRDKYVDGFGDPRIRVSGLLYGGPALSLAEFENYQPDLIVGASLAVTLPLGQYDSHQLVNIGTHRWSVKPELGISKTFGPLTLELIPSATFYTDNNDFLNGKKLEKAPLYAVQGHVIYHTRFGLWTALDATYYGGGRTTIDGEEGGQPEHLRVGATLAIPIDRHNSLKLYGSTGAYTRFGGNFTAAGIAWQFRWGGGL